jgi:penicillin-binding protein 1A
MGYDDNTPLTGVTGGGLPAEIWQEVMLRVNADLPARPLPKIIPEPRNPPVAQAPVQDLQDPQRAPRLPIEAPQERMDPVERILRDILGGG